MSTRGNLDRSNSEVSLMLQSSTGQGAVRMFLFVISWTRACFGSKTFARAVSAGFIIRRREYFPLRATDRADAVHGRSSAAVYGTNRFPGALPQDWPRRGINRSNRPPDLSLSERTGRLNQVAEPDRIAAETFKIERDAEFGVLDRRLLRGPRNSAAQARRRPQRRVRPHRQTERALALPSARNRPRQGSPRRATPRAELAASGRCDSGRKERRGCSALRGLFRASVSVSTTRSMLMAASPSLANSAFTKRTSKSALWMTSSIAYEGQKIVDHACENRLVLENGGAMPVDPDGLLGDGALRIDERVKDLAGQALVHDLDGANFQHPMSVGRIEACRFRVEHDFTHGGLDLPPAPRLSA